MSRPNVILIYPDQYRYDCMSMLGHPTVKTPNLDTLAGESAVFSTAYTSFPLCCPFRGSLMTGLYAHKNGMWCNHMPIPLNQDFVADLARKDGYHTGWIGKWHLNGGPKFVQVPEKYHLGFEEFTGYSRGHHYTKSLFYKKGDPTPRTSPRYEPEFQTDQMIDFVDRASSSGEPFMGMMCYGLPHPPVNEIPDEYVVYKPEDIVIPDTVPEWERDKVRKFCSKYYSMIHVVDRETGKLIDHLKAKGLWDNTVFIFVSDHGELCGEHGLWHKRSFYDGSQHVPLIIHTPGGKARTIGQIVDPSVDLTPTILDYCGIEIPSAMEGQSLRKLIETGEDPDKRDYVYCQVIGIDEGEWNSGRIEMKGGVSNENIRRTFPERGIRTKEWLYIEKEGAPHLLFDLKKDPGERFNLVDSGQYLDKVLEMQDWLHKLMDEFGDDWSIRVTHAPEGYQDPREAEFSFSDFIKDAIVDDPWAEN